MKLGNSWELKYLSVFDAIKHSSLGVEEILWVYSELRRGYFSTIFGSAKITTWTGINTHTVN